MNIEIGAHADDRHEGYVSVDTVGSPDVRADIRALPFRHLDRIFASHVIEHVPDADVVLALKSCRRALRPGGTLELYTPDLPWVMRRFLRAQSQGEKWSLWLRHIFGEQTRDGQFHYTGFSTQRMVTCLTAAGFRQITVRRAKRKERLNVMEVHAKGIA